MGDHRSQDVPPEPSPPTRQHPLPPTPPPPTSNTPTAPPPTTDATAQTSRKHSLPAAAAQHFVPGVLDLPPRKRVQLLALIAGVVAVVTLIGFLAGFYFELQTTGARVDAEEDARRAADLAQPPFTAVARYDNEEIPEFWYMLLDRPLTAPEQQQLQALWTGRNFPAAVWRFIRPLGGRLIHTPSSVTNMPESFLNDHPMNFAGGSATTFRLNIFSERATHLSITDMRAVNISCRPPTAQTVIEFPPQGGAVYASVALDLSSADPVPYAMDHGPYQGEPYFRHHKIDLGGQMSPGALRVEALVWEESCEWEIEATYSDSSPQGGGKVILRDGSRPFFAEARPARPVQHWTPDPYAELPRLVACHETSGPFCPK